MKIMDRNGRLFGKLSVIDLLVVAVVVVMAAALHFKSNQTLTGTTVTEQAITFQIRARGVRNYVADAIRVGDGVYDQNYSSGGRALGTITEVQVARDPGSTMIYFNDGSVEMVDTDDTVDLLITVEGVGLVSDRNYSINRVYDLAVNSARGYYTRTSQFTGTVDSIG